MARKLVRNVFGKTKNENLSVALLSSVSVKFLGKREYWILGLRTIDFVGR